MPLRTEQDFYDLALRYCSRRETSAAKMKQYLTRKFREWHPDEAKGASHSDERPWWLQAIEQTLNKLIEKQIISDHRYADILRREYERRGKGKRYIQLKLKEKGLENSLVDYASDAERELEAAIALAQKWHQRPKIANLTNRYEIKSKLMQKLVAAGFEFDVAKRAIESILLTSPK